MSKKNTKQLKTKPQTLRSIVSQGKINYPDSRFLRHQWIRKTLTLLEDEKHILYNDRVEMWKISVLK